MRLTISESAIGVGGDGCNWGGGKRRKEEEGGMPDQTQLGKRENLQQTQVSDANSLPLPGTIWGSEQYECNEERRRNTIPNSTQHCLFEGHAWLLDVLGQNKESCGKTAKRNMENKFGPQFVMFLKFVRNESGTGPYEDRYSRGIVYKSVLLGLAYICFICWPVNS